MRPLAQSLPLCLLLTIGACSSSDETSPTPLEDTATADDTGSADAAEEDTAEPTPLQWCDGGIAALYEPLSGNRLDSLPDDYFTMAADTRTGLQVSFGDRDWLSDLPEAYQAIYRDVETLDGWGLNAGIHLRFDSEVAFADDPDGIGGAIGLYALENGTATPIPYEVRIVSDGKSALFFPLVPLAQGTRHALVLTRDALAPEVGCIRASDTLQALLTGEAVEPGLAPLNERYAEVLTALDLSPDEIGHAVVFTTQTVTDQSVAAAADVAARQMEWVVPPGCGNPNNGIRYCKGRFKGYDYRRADGSFASEPQDEWTIEFDIRLPVGEGPFPLVVYGHGITIDRFTAAKSAEVLAPLGIAVAAIDAPHHGDHPTSVPGGEPFDSALGLLGASLDELTLDAKQIRNNLRQAASDKLQMLRLLELFPDIDGDGEADLDLTRVGYHGVSLGGIMGPELMALHPNIQAGVLAVPGGRLSTLFIDSEIMSLFLALLKSLVDDPSDADRLIPVAQTAIDSGDPATWGYYATQARIDDSDPPSVLLMMAFEDETIPTSATHALARSMRVPVVEPLVVDPMVVGTVVPPVSTNLNSATGGLFQFDRVRQSAEGEPERSKHNNTAYSYEGKFQVNHFFDTWLTTGTPEIINPFTALDTPEK